MSAQESGRDNRDRPPDEQFLVDGVAPAVIGGVEPEPPPAAGPAEPPTAPIPALGPDQPPERRSWFGKLFRASPPPRN